jgi:hypothetical protein
MPEHLRKSTFASGVPDYWDAAHRPRGRFVVDDERQARLFPCKRI